MRLNFVPGSVDLYYRRNVGLSNNPHDSVNHIANYLFDLRKARELSQDGITTGNIDTMRENIRKSHLIPSLLTGFSDVHRYRSDQDLIRKSREYKISALKLLVVLAREDYQHYTGLVLSQQLLKDVVIPTLADAYIDIDIAIELSSLMELYLAADNQDLLRHNGEWHELASSYSIKRLLTAYLDLAKHWFSDKDLTTKVLISLSKIRYGTHQAQYDHEINMYCKDMWRKLGSFDAFYHLETRREVTREVVRAKRAFEFSRERSQLFQVQKIKEAYDFLWVKRNSESLTDPPRRILPHPGQPPQRDLWRDDSDDESENSQLILNNGDGENVSEVETPTRSVNNSSIQVKTEDD